MHAVVAKSVNAAVCKTAMRRFDPGPPLTKTSSYAVLANARVAELVYAEDLKSFAIQNGLWVRVPPRAPFRKLQG